MRSHAVGLVCQNRYELTQKTLQSLYHTDQPKDSYDLFIIDNGSDPAVSQKLKEWVESAIVPVNTLIHTKKMGLGAIWNLFLNITKDYQFRTKLDNDLIFANTPVADKKYTRETTTRQASPADGGVNPGATPVAGFTMGAGAKVKTPKYTHTCFLQHLEEGISDLKLGICSLAPVKVGATLVSTMPQLGELRWLGKPCLAGACMTISKPTFDKLGYFDERMPCHIDWEYSQRAMNAKINVGYASNYCVIHLGADNPTVQASELQSREMYAKELCGREPLSPGFVSTKWSSVSSKISKAVQKNLFLNLS